MLCQAADSVKEFLIGNDRKASIRLEETVAGRTHMDVGAGGFSLNLTELRNA